MKKVSIILLSIVLIIVAIIFISPFVIGFLVKNNFSEVLNTISSPKIKFELVSYHRGWFNSQAKIKIQPQPYLKIDSGSSITVVENITHGPFFFVTDLSGKKHFTFGQAYLALKPLAGKVFAANTIIDSNGNIKGFVRIPHLILSSKSDTNLVYRDIQGVYTITSDLKHMQGHIQFSNALGTFPNGTVQLKHMTAEFKMRKGPLGFWLRDQSVSLQSVQVNMPSNKLNLTLSGIKGHIVTRENNNRFNVLVTLELQNVIDAKEKTGPYQLNLSVNELDMDSLQKLMSFLKENSGFANKKLTRFQEQQFAALFLDLVGKGVKLSLNQLSVTTQEGRVLAQGGLTLPEQKNSGGLAQALVTAKANFKLTLPPALLSAVLNEHYDAFKKANPNSSLNPSEIAQKQIGYWIKTGWLTQAGDQLQFDLNYQAGRVLINGRDQKTLPSPQLPAPEVAKPKVPEAAKPEVPEKSKEQIVKEK